MKIQVQHTAEEADLVHTDAVAQKNMNLDPLGPANVLEQLVDALHVRQVDPRHQ